MSCPAAPLLQPRSPVPGLPHRDWGAARSRGRATGDGGAASATSRLAVGDFPTGGSSQTCWPRPPGAGPPGLPALLSLCEQAALSSPFLTEETAALLPLPELGEQTQPAVSGTAHGIRDRLKNKVETSFSAGRYFAYDIF